MKEYTIKHKFDNINDIINYNRINRYYGAKKKKEEQNAIREAIKQIPPIKKYPIKIVFTWYVKNTNSDLDNKTPKTILDCMQEEGILINDNIKHITSIEHRAIKSDTEQVKIQIEEV